MTEIKFDTGTDHFSHTDRNAKHTILLTKYVTTSHYVCGVYDNTSVTIKNELMDISHSDAVGTMLRFVAEDGQQVTLVLSNVAPEQLCDAVEAARLQEVDG